MIRVEHLEKTYDLHKSHANHVLKDISLTLPDTGFVCILGPSGCGKTTLMNVIGGLDTFDSGTITVGEISASRYGTEAMEQERNRCFGYIFQNYYLLRDRSVTYNVYQGLHSLPLSRTEKLKRVKKALREVGMERFARKKVGELSGGQQQRTAIARALARQPRVIFADEPTGNLDGTNTDQVCRLLRKIAANCLVVMVTHEERIAGTYADRILRLRDGKICSDEENQPEAEAAAAGEMNEEKLSGAEAAGERKEVRKAGPAGAGRMKGNVLIGKKEKSAFYTCFREARSLMESEGKRTKSLLACLFVLTAMTVLAVGDYITTGHIEPEDFIMNDSHLLEVEIERGRLSSFSISEDYDAYVEYLDDSGLDIMYLPVTSERTAYGYRSFVQMDTLTEYVSGFSYIPADRLSPDQLLYGRMPEGPEEAVADRWTLERFLEKDGVLQASITDITHFLGMSLHMTRKDIELTIVGICDSKEPAIYVDPFAMLSIGAAGASVMSLTQLKQLYPGCYDDWTLEDDETLAGPSAATAVAGGYLSAASRNYQIRGLVEDDIYARLVVNENQYEPILRSMMRSTRHFLIYTSQKQEVKQYASSLPEDLKDRIEVKVTDYYTDYMNQYRAAAAKRVNARTIVTAALLIVSAIMLVLMLKARVNGRIELLAVHRLLGISSGRVLGIFALETLCLSAAGALPAAVACWAVVKALTVMPSISFQMVLPFTVAMAAYLCALLVHLAASLLPVARLLRLPPAVLAGKYDF